MPRSADISPLSLVLSRVDAVTDGSRQRDSIACGFPSLDKMLGGGFRQGDLIVLGGDVSSGKSALALAFAIRAALGGARVAFVTGESSVERVHERIIAIEARARIDDLRQGALDDAARAKAGAVALGLRDSLPLIVPLVVPIAAGAADVTRSSADAAERSNAAHLAAHFDRLPDMDLVVIDPATSLLRGIQTFDHELSSVIRDLKHLALERSIAILTTAPLPLLSARPDRRPTLDDFGALGAVKHHADVVLGLYRPDMYEPSRDITGATELLIRKNRNGPTGYIDLYFYAQWMRFEDMLDPDR